MTSTAKARHRLATRPSTPLSGMAPVARRGAALAAGSGLALTMVATGAYASDSAQAKESAGSLEASAGVGLAMAQVRDAVVTNETLTAGDVADSAELTAVPEVSVEQVQAPAPQTPAQAEDEAEDTGRDAARATEQASERQARQTQVEVPASAAGSSIAAIAMQYQGVPYVAGGATPAGWDCSGFVQYVYAQAGISLPRTSYGQGAAGTLVSAAQAQPGDIVYYGSHVGIYMGNGMMIDAGTPATGTSYRAVYGTPIGYVRVG